MTLPGPRLRRTLLVVLAGVVASLSCGREITGPDGGQPVARGFLFDVRFPPMGGANSVASDLIPFTKVRVVMVNLRGETVVNRVVDFPSNADTVELELTVPLSFNAPSEGEAMDLSLAFVNAAGDTVFRAGPVEVLVVPSSNPDPPPPPVLEPTYVGPGANAESVVISPDGTSLVAGDPFTFTAQALDASLQPIANTPIGWESLDPSKATIANASAGAGVTLPSRGTARIVAELATGQKDTVVITIAPKLQGLVKVSGDAQSAMVGALLSQPVVARVTATDGLPLEGVTVDFAALDGGSVGTPSAVTGADGLVQTTWTLGPGAGAQSLTATVSGAPAIVTTFTATATAAAVNLIHHYPVVGNPNDAVGTAHGSALGSIGVTTFFTFDGSSAYVQFPSRIVPTSGSYAVSLFVRNRTAAGLTAEYISQGSSNGPGFYVGQGIEGELRAGDSWVNTGEPRVPNDGLFHHVVVVVDASVPSSKLYIDGVLEQTLPSAIGSIAGGTNTRLGRQFDPFNEYFNGDLDELRVYDGAITAATVTTLYDAGPSTPDRLVFQQLPSNSPAGATLSPTVIVRVEDAMGRLRTTFNGNVALSVASGPSGLNGGTTVAAVNGIATFSSVFINTAGTYTLQAAIGGGVTAVSAPFDVVAAATTSLAVGQEPTSVATGAAISPPITIRARDAFGNTATSYTGDITLAFGNNPSGATLGGTTTVAAVAGVATFSDITVSAAGTGYTLIASASGLSGAGTAAFNVISGGPTINAWINASGGNWSVGANWSEGRAPIEADSVVIAAEGTYTVTLDVNATVSDLIVGGGTGIQTLALPSSRALTVNGIVAIQPTGNVSMLSASSMSGAGTLTILGTLTATGATFNVPVLNLGTFVGRASTSITAAYTSGLQTSVLRTEGSTSGTANLTIADGFVNVGVIELTSLGSGFNSTLTITSGTLTNASTGTIVSLPGAGGSRTLAAALDNQGTVTLTTGLTVSKADADHFNTGTINAVGGSFVVNQSGTAPTFANAGTIALSAGRNAAFTSGTVDLTGGTVSGYGGTLSVTGSTLIFTNPTVRTMLAVGAGTVIPSPFTIPAGDSLRLVTGTFTAPNLVIDGALIAEDAVTISSAITKTATSSLIVRGSSAWGAATLTVANGFANNGVIELTSVGSGFNSTLAVTAGTLLNAPSATILSSVGVGGSRSLAAQVNNQGTITVANALTIAKADAVHLNSGLIDLTTNNLTVTQSGTGSPSFANTGSITMASGRTLSVSGGALDLTGGTVGGYAATLSTSSMALTFTVPEARTRLAFGAGTVIAAGFTIPAGDSLRLVTGTFAAPTLQNDGQLIVEDVVTVTSAVTTGAGSQIITRGSAAYGASTLTFANGFANAATIELTSVGSGFGSTLAVTAGTLVNAPDGTIVSSSGVGGSRVLSTQLDNQGTVTVASALTLSKTDAVHVNSGLIDLTTSDLTIVQSGTGSPSFANSGTIAMASGRTLSVSGGALDLTGGTISGYAATLSTTNATLTFTVPEARTRLQFLTGTTIPSAFTIPAGDSLRLVGGTFAAPTLQNDGDLVIEDVVTVTSAITTGNGSAIIVRGSAAYGAATLTVANGFTNTAEIDLTSVVSGFGSTLAVTTGALVNAPGATILSSLGVGGSRVLAAQLDNQGTLTVAAPLSLAKADAAHLNSGLIDLTTNNLTITQTGTTPSFSNTGAITMSAGRALTVSGGALTLTGGTVTGYGATLATSATTLSFTVPEARTRLSFGAGTSIPAAFTIPSGDSLRLVTGTFTAPTLQNDGDLIIEDLVTVTSAITTGNGSAIIVRGSAAYGASVLTVANGFTNTSEIDLTSVVSGFASTLTVTTGTLVNAPGATILSSAGVGGSRVLVAQLDNQGTLTVAAPLSLAKADAVHLNSGLIDLTANNLTITQTGTGPSFANSGTVAMANGRALTVSGGALDLSGGTISNYAATLVTSNTTLTFTVPEARTRLQFGIGTAIPAAFTIPEGDSLRLVTGTFAAPTLQNDGDLIIEDLVTVTSAITTGPGSAIIVRGSAAYGAATLTLPTTLTNTATIDLTSVVSGFGSSIAVTTGSLVNTSTGTILSSVGVGGSRTIAAQLDNQGTVTVNTDLTLAKASALHTNSGLIDLVGNNLTVTQSGTGPSFSNTGAIDLASSRTMTVSGGALTLTGGTVDGYGATLVTSNTTLTFTVPEARTRLQFGTGTAIPAAFTIPEGDSLRLVTGTFTAPTLQNDGDLIIEDLVTVTSAITTGNGSAIIVRGSAAYGAATLTVANGFTNTAEIDLTSVVSGFGSTLAVTTGPLVNAPGASILASAGVGGSRSLAAQIDNQGTITVNAPLVLTKADADHLNSGAINVAAADLQITQSGTTPTFSNTGAITLTAGRSVTNSNGTLDLTGGTLSGYGATLTATGATTLLFTVPEARTRLALGTGTVIPSAFTVPAGDSLRLITGSFTAPSLVLNGTLIIEDIVSVSSAITTGAAADTAIIVRGSAAFGAATLTVTTGFTNTGIIQLTSVVSGFGSTFNITTGSLTNASGATIVASVGVGGSRVIGPPIVQNGILSVPASATLTLGGLLTLNPGSSSTVLGTLNTTGGCVANGGNFSGFACP